MRTVLSFRSNFFIESPFSFNGVDCLNLTSVAGYALDHGPAQCCRQKLVNLTHQYRPPCIDFPMHFPLPLDGAPYDFCDISRCQMDADRVNNRSMCCVHHGCCDKIGHHAADIDAMPLPFDIQRLGKAFDPELA